MVPDAAMDILLDGGVEVSVDTAGDPWRRGLAVQQIRGKVVDAQRPANAILEEGRV